MKKQPKKKLSEADLAFSKAFHRVIAAKSGVTQAIKGPNYVPFIVAFYPEYDTPEGKEALRRVWNLRLCGTEEQEKIIRIFEKLPELF